MAWLRMGDTVADHPIVLAPLEAPDADERTVDEVFGFMTRLWLRAALHPHATDYVVPFALAIHQAWGNQQRARRILDLATFAGYGWLEVDDESGRQRFRFIDDPKFVHMKTQETIDFEGQRRADHANPNVTVPVRYRDGDACRYCGLVVDWSDRKGGKGGTYDHRPPGLEADPERSVVACKSCNSQRGVIQQSLGISDPWELLAAIDAIVPLLPPPPNGAYYKPATFDLFERNAAILRTFGLEPPAKPRGRTKPIPAGNRAPGTAPRPERPSDADTAPAPGVRPAGADNATPCTRPNAGHAQPHPPGAALSSDSREVGNRSRSSADRRYAGSGSAGTGRDGSGQAGTGRDGSRAASRRRRRGRRGRGPSAGGGSGG